MPRSRPHANITRRPATPERVDILTYEGAFHGRTLATLAAGGQKKYLEGFGPVAGGFDPARHSPISTRTKKAITPTPPPRS